jgi:hypothetical protein
VVACSRLLANSVRAVGTVHGLDAKARNRPGLPFTLSAEYSGFLFKSHPFDQILMFHENLLPMDCNSSQMRVSLPPGVGFRSQHHLTNQVSH